MAITNTWDLVKEYIKFDKSKESQTNKNETVQRAMRPYNAL